MAVRIKLLLRPIKGRQTEAAPIEVAAVVNSGYEVDHAELILPVKLAQHLGLWPSPPVGAQFVDYSTAGGDVRVCRVPEALLVALPVWEPGHTAEIADVAISEQEHEILLSDALSGKIGLILVDIARGN